MIFVFKTTVRTRKQAKLLKPHLEEILPSGTWNFDLSDSDRILRIEINEDPCPRVMSLLKLHNFECEVLE